MVADSAYGTYKAAIPVRRRLYRRLLEAIPAELVPLRRQHIEPRVVKRRPKPFPRMQQPCSVLKAKLAA